MRPLPERKRALDRAARKGRQRPAVEHEIDGVLLGLGEPRRCIGRHQATVDPRLGDAGARGGSEKVEVRPFARLHRGRQDDTRLFGARELGQDGVDAERRNWHVAVRAMWFAELREQQAQVVRDLGHRGHGGVHAGARRALLERDGGRNAGDAIDVGPRHGGQELTRVGRERLEEAPLPFGEHDVEGERALAGAARPGDDAELPVRKLAGYFAQVVLARVLDDDGPVFAVMGRAAVRLCR